MAIWHAVVALLSWQFFGYVDYVLNVITPESFAFDFEAIAVIDFVILVSVISLALAMFRKKRWAEKFDYEKIRELVEDQLPRNVETYKEFHALLVQLGKDGDY